MQPKKKKKPPGRPSPAKRATAAFKGQYASTRPLNTPAGQVKSQQKNYRLPPETEEMLEDLSGEMNYTETDTGKLAIVFASRNIPMLKDQLSRRALSLMTRVTPDTERFAPALRLKPAGPLTLDLLKVLADFAAIMHIEDQTVRNQAFEALLNKIQLIFSKAKDLQAVPTEEPLATELELA